MSTPQQETTDGRAKSKDPVTGRPAGAGSAGKKPARWPWALLAVALVVVVIVVAARTFAARNTSTVSVTAGASALTVVEIAAPQTGGVVTTVAQGSVVNCRVAAGEGPGQVGIAVVETGRREDALWARLRITAEPGAAAGRRMHDVSFDIDGAPVGPDARLVVQVKP